MIFPNVPHAHQHGAGLKYATAKTLARAHATYPLLWRTERQASEAVPNQLIAEALDYCPVSKGLAALAGSRGLGFEFWVRLRTRRDAGGNIAVACLEGALTAASGPQGVFLPCGVRDLHVYASLLQREPRWKAALDRFIRHEQVTIRSWATDKKRLITRLSRTSAARKGRFFVALINLAEQQGEPDAVRILCLQALDTVYRHVPDTLIKTLPVALLREAYPSVTTQLTANTLLSRPEVLTDRPWVLQILNGQLYRDEIAANLPTLALRVFSGQHALTEARDLFGQFVQPSPRAMQLFTSALASTDPALREMLTPAIVVTCLSSESREAARVWLLKELGRLSQ